MITSSSNAQIRAIEALLKKSKERKEQKAFVVEGKKMFEELLSRRELLKKVFFSESYVSEYYPEGLKDILSDIPYEIVAEHVFCQMSETVTPQGVLAIAAMPEYSLEQMISSKEKKTLLLLEDLRDPGNLGTILRTAEAADVAGVILTKESVDVYNPKVIRSTMGAVFRVPFVYADDFFGLLEILREQGVRLLAAHLKGNKTFTEADYSGACGILIGNEANGLSERAAELATEKVLIPMAGKTESLNAAVAAALLMYEAFRSRRRF